MTSRTRAVLFVAAVCTLLGTAASAGDISMKANLVDADAKARNHTATIEVTVVGVEIVDPASVKEQPHPGQGHLHYKVDDGPAIATTSTKLSFHDLTAGKHVFDVILAGNDHKPLGPEVTLSETIP